MSDFNNFIAFLSGKSTKATLFEPKPHRNLVTKLIWRGGDELWDSPKHKCETLVEFYAYIKSDVAIIEPEGSLDEMLAVSLKSGMKYVIISDDENELESADKSSEVCALATRGEFVRTEKPLICIAKENEAPNETVARYESGSFSAVYIQSDAERYAAKARVLGGIGTDKLAEGNPLGVYKRVENLASLGVAIGSGGTGEDVDYLGFISMLGQYNKLL